MDYREVCNAIFRLYLYADNAKMIHYSTDSAHCHELADGVRQDIIEFADELAEQYFGFFGKPEFSQLSVGQDISVEEDINRLCQRCVNIADAVRLGVIDNDKLSGIVSLVDGFKEKMSKNAFLGTFDKVSNFKLKS